MVSTYDIQADLARLTRLGSRLEAERWPVGACLVSGAFANRESPEYKAMAAREDGLRKALTSVHDAIGHLSDILEGE